MRKRRKKAPAKSRKGFSERASRVADIILDQDCADKRRKAKQINREVFSMLTDLKQRIIDSVAGRDLIREAACGVGKLSGLPKRAYHDVFNAFKS